MSDDFFRTNMGRQFYEGTMPQIARSLGKLAAAVEKIAEKTATEPTPSSGASFPVEGYAIGFDHSDKAGRPVAVLVAHTREYGNVCYPLPEGIVSVNWPEIAKTLSNNSHEWVRSLARDLRHLPDDHMQPVTCKFCGVYTVESEAHMHANGWVCEGCWDDRLRSPS